LARKHKGIRHSRPPTIGAVSHVKPRSVKLQWHIDNEPITQALIR
jgi:hypothetical protein